MICEKAVCRKGYLSWKLFAETVYKFAIIILHVFQKLLSRWQLIVSEINKNIRLTSRLFFWAVCILKKKRSDKKSELCRNNERERERGWDEREREKRANDFPQRRFRSCLTSLIWPIRYAEPGGNLIGLITFSSELIQEEKEREKEGERELIVDGLHERCCHYQRVWPSASALLSNLALLCAEETDEPVPLCVPLQRGDGQRDDWHALSHHAANCWIRRDGWQIAWRAWEVVVSTSGAFVWWTLQQEGSYREDCWVSFNQPKRSPQVRSEGGVQTNMEA